MGDPTAHPDPTTTEIREFVSDHVTSSVSAALTGDATNGHGWLRIGDIRDAAVRHFGIRGGGGGRGFASTPRDRMDGRVTRAVDRLATDGVLVVWKPSDPLRGLHDGPVAAVGRLTGRPVGNATVWVTTPEGHRESVAAAHAAARMAADQATTADGLGHALASRLGLSGVTVRPARSLNGTVTYTVSFTADDAALILTGTDTA